MRIATLPARFSLLVAAPAALLMAFLSATVVPPRAEAARAVDPLRPKQGVLLGAHVADARGDISEAGFLALEARLGHKLAIDHYYRPWTKNFPDGRERWNFGHGRIPMISWGKADTGEISRGTHDALIRSRAIAVAALGKPVFIRWFWEMDGKHNGEGPAFSVEPAPFIEAWRRIHTIFGEQGATNVSWVWCPNAWNFNTGRSQQFYPGDDYVDWICSDGYNWFPANKGAKDESFKQIFQAFYNWAGAHPKPLMIGEFGAMDPRPGFRAAWLQAAHATVKTEFTKIAALVYFNHKGLPHEAAGIDWRVDTSEDSVQALAAMAADPWFNPVLGDEAPVPPVVPPPPPFVPAPPAVVPESRFPVLLALSAMVVALAAIRRNFSWREMHLLGAKRSKESRTA